MFDAARIDGRRRDLACDHGERAVDATSENFLTHNDLGKLSYQLSPVTSATASYFDAVTWSDSIGNGDNGYLTFEKRYYDLSQASVASGCTAGAPMSFETDNAPKCFSVYDAAKMSYGHVADGATRQRGTRLNDVHLRVMSQLGGGSINVDAFADQYAFTKNSHGATLDANGTPIDALYQVKYNTTGVLLSDDYTSAANDIGFGLSTVREIDTGNQFSTQLAYGLYDLGQYPSGSNDIFIRDTFRPTDKSQSCSTFGRSTPRRRV